MFLTNFSVDALLSKNSNSALGLTVTSPNLRFRLKMLVHIGSGHDCNVGCMIITEA